MNFVGAPIGLIVAALAATIGFPPIQYPGEGSASRRHRDLDFDPTFAPADYAALLCLH